MAIAADLKAAINGPGVKQERRWHLGISIIGQECLRKTWYDYRWYSTVVIDGRMQRLFARGHAEEEKIHAMLRSVGWNVEPLDIATGKQFVYSAVHGHYGGSCDGFAYDPDGKGYLLECKTHNTKSFTHTVGKALVEGKPQHYKQMCGYGYAFKHKEGLYFAVNKNDDDIYPEFVDLDWDFGQQMELRAESLITSKQPPARISNKSTDYRCVSCEHNAVCHLGAAPERHCRSCAHSSPTENSNWYCAYYARDIPKHIVYIGCDNYERLS